MKLLRPLASLLSESGPKLALIILNRPLDIPLLTHLWKKSIYVAVTDGAINRLHKYFGDRKDEYLPNLVTGDFDSANPSTLDYYRNKGVAVQNTPDQDETDFTKCLRVVVEKTKETGVEQFIAIGSFGGRLDHSMSNINTLFLAQSLCPQPVILLCDGNMACLLDKGEHKLQVNTGMEAEYCGLIPIGHPADHVTTSGLKYNLDDSPMKFGELISTSNSLASSTVTVKTDQPLLWTMAYKPL